MKIEKIYLYFISEILRIRIKPRTIQLPITGKCNSCCTTCNVWKQKIKNDMDVSKLKKIVEDKYLSNVKNVGVNGGEPFLHSQFNEIINCLMKLPKLKNIYIITNGINTKLIVDTLKETKKICKKNNVKLFLTVSFDGVDEIYYKVRGVKNAYDKVYDTIHVIMSNQSEFCDSFSLGTTVSTRNVGYLSQIKNFSSYSNLSVNYHIAVPNRRIFTENVNDYSVLNNQLDKMIATEFFYSEFKCSKSFKKKLLYFQNYYYLVNNGTKRISACSYKKEDITIDENCDVYFCARESKVIGNGYDTPIRNIVKSNKAKRESLRIYESCSSCGHYITMPTIKGLLLFIIEIGKPSIWIYYEMYCQFMCLFRRLK